MAEAAGDASVVEPPLVEAFVRAWRTPTDGGRPRAAESLTPAAAAAWLKLVAQGSTAWPELTVDGAPLAAHIVGHLTPDTSDLTGALQALCAADLYLGFACAAGVPGALACFERACAIAIDATIARVDRSPGFRDEVRQALHERLFVGTAGEPARIASYAGRGPLVAWVAIATRRVALSLRRGQANRTRIEERAMTEAIEAGHDPELEYLKVRYRDQFQAALRAALGEVPDRDRTLLRLNLVEGITLDRMGIMFGVDASTISRWLTRARTSILHATEEHMRRDLDVSPSEFASLARLVVSQLDISIAALFDVRVHRS